MSGEIGGKTANKIRAVLSSLFAYAKEHHGYVCPDPDLKTPIDAVKRFTEEHPPIVWLKSDDIAKQLEALTEYPEIRAMVATCIYAGLRRSEVLWLTKEDVDFEKRLIRVQAKHVDDDAWKPKTRKNRTVPINSKLMEELKNYTATPREGKWFFPASNGGRWDADYFSEFLRELVTVHAPSATRIGAGWPARCAATASRR
jgi:integrase